MKMNEALAAVVAASLVGAPVAAQAAAVDGARTSSTVAEGENIKGGWFVPVLAIIAVLLGILAIVNNGDDLPTSP